MSPAEIAARLSPAQKRALVKMPRHHSRPACTTRLILFLDGLQEHGRLTPLGLAVRAEIERMEKQ
jgi:hypothetical protein